MQKVSYMGDGSTTEFSFNFPYFENSNIVVTKNNTAATGYNIIGTSAAPDADIPYTGGKVVFEIAPTTLDSITISRSLPLSRIVDYQPTAKLEPTTLNQDANYLMEVIKDLQDELDSLCAQYADIADKESTTTLLARISAIHDEIVAVSAQIAALGDISTLQDTVSDLQDDVSDLTTITGNHTTSIGTLDTRTTGLLDYVVESQQPTSANNYTWYRKYKSGWIEQGGTIDKTTNQQDCSAMITFPVEMADIFYSVSLNGYNTDTGPASMCTGSAYRSDSGFFAYCFGFGSTDKARYLVWQITGMAA